MKNSLLAVAAALTSWLGGVVVAVAFLLPGHELTGAVITVSPCGIYNITTAHADGELTHYPDAPPPLEVLVAIDALAPEARAIVLVPCPTIQVPQREAKSQEIPEARSARHEAPRDGAHRRARSG